MEIFILSTYREVNLDGISERVVFISESRVLLADFDFEFENVC